MNLIITDELTKEVYTYQNVSCIPRLGEKIFFGYTPSAKIDDVIYDFKSSTCYVVCNKQN